MNPFKVGCSFLGVNCSQAWMDLLLWEELLNVHTELRSIVELGTGEGGFSRFLKLQADSRGLSFSTFDHVHMPTHNLDGFQCVDIFENPQPVLNALLNTPTVLFCDNGDKPKEVEVFGSQLRVGDLLVVHDWNLEVRSSDIPSYFLPIHNDWWNEWLSHSRVFVRVPV